MKKLLHWQFWTAFLGIASYLIWRNHGYDQNQAVYCAVISIVAFAMFTMNFFLADSVFVIEIGPQKEKQYTLVSVSVVSLISLWAAGVCGATFYEKLIVLCLAVTISLLAAFETLLVLALLVFVFLIAFGVQPHAAIVIFCITTVFGFLLIPKEQKHRISWILLSAGAQAAILATFFLVGQKVIK